MTTRAGETVLQFVETTVAPKSALSIAASLGILNRAREW